MHNAVVKEFERADAPKGTGQLTCGAPYRVIPMALVHGPTVHPSLTSDLAGKPSQLLTTPDSGRPGIRTRPIQVHKGSIARTPKALRDGRTLLYPLTTTLTHGTDETKSTNGTERRPDDSMGHPAFPGTPSPAPAGRLHSPSFFSSGQTSLSARRARRHKSAENAAFQYGKHKWRAEQKGKQCYTMRANFPILSVSNLLP